LLTGSPDDFTVGNTAVDPNPVTGSGIGVPFNLTTEFDGGNLGGSLYWPVSKLNFKKSPPFFYFLMGLAFVRSKNSFGIFDWVMGMFLPLASMYTHEC